MTSRRISVLLSHVVFCLTNLICIAVPANSFGAPLNSAARTAAMEAFNERCKTAGEKIYRTVEGVEGLFVLKPRPEGINYGDQYRLTDPYGLDHTGLGYLESFLRGFYSKSTRPTMLTPPRNAYLYVDAIDATDGLRYRYTGRIEEPWQSDKSFLKGYKRFVMDKSLTSAEPPRYGVTFDDISTSEDRKLWIAGSSLRVVDIKTGEVIAERIGYMVDLAQGDKAQGRSPWLYAADNSCPKFPGPHAFSSQPGQTEEFVEKVLKPIKGK